MNSPILTEEQAKATGKPTISHSQISSWRSCQMRWRFANVDKLVSKRIERPLSIGSWVHRALETHYGPEADWRAGHGEYAAAYEKLFDEEKLALDKGKSKKASDDRADYEPLPLQVERIMRSYKWYYRKENIRTIAVEVHFWVDMGEYLLHGVIDHIYEDLDTGLIWIRDHKVWDDLPDENAFHTMDPQTTIYFRGAEVSLGVEASGVEFNYVRSAAPSFPSQNQNGSISKRAVDTDYPTAFRWLKANGFEPRDYSDMLVPLYGQSPFLRRYRLTRHDDVTNRILADAHKTALEILHHDSTVRNITRQCNWCPYQQICRGELYGIDTSAMRRQNFLTEKQRDALREKRGVRL